ncbi:MAG: hypothetical protein ACTSRA_03065 [Promethearchaeota archaeon]
MPRGVKKSSITIKIHILISTLFFILVIASQSATTGRKTVRENLRGFGLGDALICKNAYIPANEPNGGHLTHDVIPTFIGWPAGNILNEIIRVRE